MLPRAIIARERPLAPLLIAVLALALAGCRQSKAVIAAPVKPSQSAPLFEEIAESAGVPFHHFAGATKQMYLTEIMGSGVALIDYNNDGALDIFVIQGGFVNPRQPAKDILSARTPAQPPGCRLYRNDLKRTGKLHFTDVTEQAGLGHINISSGMGVAVGDYDNDGYADLYVSGYGRSVLLRNTGHGAFIDVTRVAGVGNDGAWATSAAFVDYDLDGRLDIVVANYVDLTMANNRRCVSTSGTPEYCGPTSYHGTAPKLYHNLGNGRFEDATRRSGLGSVRMPGLGVSCADFDGDGWPDILFANDQAPNTLWLNKRNGTFHETARGAGCAYGADGRTQANMGLAVGDTGNVGREDVVVTHLINESVTLFRNDGHANFLDTTAEAALRDTTYPFTGFGADFFDYDNDGWLDLFITNGVVTPQETQHNDPWPYRQTNQLFHNQGDGRKFAEVTDQAGPALKLRGVGRGAAFGDLDDDGKIDVVVSNNNGPVFLLHNVVPTTNHWLLVKLVGSRCNRMGLGARVGLVRKGQSTIWRRCHSDGSYCSASDSRVHFGLGQNAAIDSVMVEWPGHGRQTYRGVLADRLVTLKEGD